MALLFVLVILSTCWMKDLCDSENQPMTDDLVTFFNIVFEEHEELLARKKTGQHLNSTKRKDL